MGDDTRPLLRTSPTAALFVASLAALFAELLLIRWLASEVPILGYFKNFPLLAAFIGLGAGSLLADRPRRYWASSMWTLAALCIAITFTEQLGWHELIFPDAQIDVWERRPETSGDGTALLVVRNLGVVFALMAACVWSFVGVGQVIGSWFRQGPPLRMYTADILGSLAGTGLFALVSYLGTPPSLWLLLAAALLAATAATWFPRGRGLRVLLPLLGLLAAAALVQRSSGDLLLRWSPYYRIEVMPKRNKADPNRPPVLYRLNVNRDFHQNMVDVSDSWLETFPSDSRYFRQLSTFREQYDFPYRFKERPASVLIGGAGSGNNTAGALRNGAGRVTAVEIDSFILDLGSEMHPARPYQEDAVRLVNDDIRSFLRWSDETFDLIEYGILDSHTALSSLSSLRLENYVYTVEGIQDAVRHLKPDGIICLTFYEAGREWIGQRMFRNITLATGEPPLVTKFASISYFLFGPGLSREAARAVMDRNGYPDRSDHYAAGDVRPSTDDWPFLYSNPAGQPRVYYLSLFLVVAGAGAFIFRILRGGAGGVPIRIDWHMFLLGAGFLLIETKAIAELSLLFGSTWIVNTLVFAGIFVMVLLSVWAVERGWGIRVDRTYALLGLVLVGWFLFPRTALSGLPFAVRALTGTLLVVLPIFFAGIVFARSFQERENPPVAFGSNLLGAVVGGASEAVSLGFGIRSLTLLAVAFYLASWAVLSLANPGRQRESSA